MRIYVLLLMLIGSVASQAFAQGLSCEALRREFILKDGVQTVTEERAPLVAINDSKPPYQILEAQVQDRAFTVTGLGPDHDFMVTITVAPDFIQGVITTARPDSSGRLSLSTVNGPLVYKVECFEN